MDKKEPRIITFEDIQQHVSSDKRDDVLVIGGDFSVMHHANVIDMFDGMVTVGVPFRFIDTRIVLVVNGEAEGVVNLMDFHFRPGMVIFFGKGCTIQLNSHTADYQVDAVAFSEDYVGHLTDNRIFKEYSGYLVHVIDQLESEEMAQAEGFFSQLWKNVHSGIYDHKLLASQMTTILFYFDLIRSRHEAHSQQDTLRYEELFHRFITLVNQHHTQHRDLAFYADKMYITDKYLCLVVKQASGFTPKDWIDRALVTTAKAMLKHTSLQTVQIADRLDFPQASSFCKFFKRITGLTPTEYREG